MKTTSYKISKQLAEVGFNKYKIPATEYCWHHDNFGSTRFLVGAELEDKTTQTLVSEYKIYPAYDLETLLEALPKRIDINGVGCRFEMYSFADLDRNELISIGYMRARNFTALSSKNESLADTAARLWLNLKENNLI